MVRCLSDLDPAGLFWLGNKLTAEQRPVSKHKAVLLRISMLTKDGQPARLWLLRSKRTYPLPTVRAASSIFQDFVTEQTVAPEPAKYYSAFQRAKRNHSLA